MRTISLEVNEKTAEAIKRMSKDELERLKEKLSEILEIDMDEMNRTFGREK